MTKTFIKALAVAGVSILAFDASAANAATATATAKASIVKAITLSKATDLDYGTIVTGTTQSTVAMAPTSSATVTCGSGLVCAGAPTAASFTVTGTVGQFVTISVPATVNLTSGTNTMSSSLAASTSKLTLSNSSGDTFYVGGTLNVAPNQPEGVYSTTFTATVNYQ